MLALLLSLFVSGISQNLADTSRWMSPNHFGGPNGPVFAHLFLGGDSILVGGDFTRAGAGDARRLALWDGTEWSAFGAGADKPVRGLARDSSGGIVAVGEFDSIGEIAASSHMARLEGGRWVAFLEDTTRYTPVTQVLTLPDGSVIAVRGVYRVERWKDGRTARKWTMSTSGYEPTQIRLLGGRLFMWAYRTPIYVQTNDSAWDSIPLPTYITPTDLFQGADGTLYLLETGPGTTQQQLWKRSGDAWMRACDSLPGGRLTRVKVDRSGKFWAVGDALTKGLNHWVASLEGNAWVVAPWAQGTYSYEQGFQEIDMDSKGRLWGFGTGRQNLYQYPTDSRIWQGLARIGPDAIFGATGGRDHGPFLPVASGILSVAGDADTIKLRLGANSLAFTDTAARPLPVNTVRYDEVYPEQGGTAWDGSYNRFISRFQDTTPVTFLQLTGSAVDDPANITFTADLGSAGLVFAGNFDGVQRAGDTGWIPVHNLALTDGDTVMPLDSTTGRIITSDLHGGVAWSDTLLLATSVEPISLLRCVASARRCQGLFRFTGSYSGMVHDRSHSRTLLGGTIADPKSPSTLHGRYMLLDDTGSVLYPGPGTQDQTFEQAVPDGEGGFVAITRNLGSSKVRPLLAHLTMGGTDTSLLADSWDESTSISYLPECDILGIARTASGDLHLFGKFGRLGGKALPKHAICRKCLAPIPEPAPATGTRTRRKPELPGPIVQLYDLRGHRLDLQGLDRGLLDAGVYFGVDSRGTTRRLLLTKGGIPAILTSRPVVR